MEPELAPPGAGVPLPQLLATRLWYGPFVSKRTPREVTRKQVDTLVAKLVELANALTPEQRMIKILVPPQVGLEDSSRYWSMDGLLEHIIIVSQGIEGLIGELTAGRIPNPEVRTADFKPKYTIVDALAEFKKVMPGMMARIDAKVSKPGHDFASRAKKHHPWFGGMTARQWYWLLGTHTAIHWKQAKGIKAGLPNAAGGN